MFFFLNFSTREACWVNSANYFFFLLILLVLAPTQPHILSLSLSLSLSRCCDELHCRKIWFCIPYKTHNGSNIHRSISFMIDNMHYMIFRIWEQDSVSWCGEIQNNRLEVLGNTFNLHSNSTLRPRSVVFQSVSKGE